MDDNKMDQTKNLNENVTHFRNRYTYTRITPSLTNSELIRKKKCMGKRKHFCLHC